jgi:hypothetical protein
MTHLPEVKASSYAIRGVVVRRNVRVDVLSVFVDEELRPWIRRPRRVEIVEREVQPFVGGSGDLLRRERMVVNVITGLLMPDVTYCFMK